MGICYKTEMCFNANGVRIRVTGEDFLGMKYGQYKKEDLESRQLADRKTIEFMERFKSENGSYICNDLHCIYIS